MTTIGLDGAFMLSASMLVLVATGGLLFLWCLRRVVVTARTAPAMTADDRWRVVFGVYLGRGGGLPGDYRARLARVLALPPGPVLVVGGRTSRHDPRTEAQAGAGWLVGQGVAAAQVHQEDLSANTLENLRGARDVLAGQEPPPVLITNRYHLARASLLAQGLGLDHSLCAAEDCFAWRLSLIPKVAFEAFFMHWYLVGRTAARLLGHRGMLARIT